LKLLLFILFIFFLQLDAQAAIWNPEVRLTNIPGQSWGPRITAFNGILHVVWFEYPDFNHPEIYYSRSTDNGNSWSIPINISNNITRANIHPSVAADASGVYVFWSSDSETGETFFKRSTDGGVTWQESEQQLTYSSGYSRATDILADRQGIIHLVWYDNREGYSGVYHRQSCDHGVNWTAEERVTQFDGVVDNEDPRIIQADDNNFYILFRSSRDGEPQGGMPPYDMYLLRGEGRICPSNIKWLYPAQRVSYTLPDEYSNNYHGTISAGNGGRIHMAYWDEKASNNVIYRRCTPAGAGCRSPEDLSNFPLSHPQAEGPNAQNPGLVEDSTNGVHLFYSEHATIQETVSIGRLFYRNSGDGGLTWNPSVQLGTSAQTSAPQSVYQNGRVHVVWVDFRDNNYGSEIYYRNVDFNVKPTPLNDTAEFVRQQYRDFLNREADAEGLQYWRNVIDGGAKTKAEVIEEFFWSQEFGVRVAPLVRLYFAYFLRIPDYQGLQFWIGASSTGGWSLAAISDYFAASPEFQQRYGSLTNEQFVTLIYQNILDRDPEPGGFAFWVEELNAQKRSRGQVMLEFSESAEYKEKSNNKVYVTMMYVGMLRRSPDQEGFDFWVQYLDSGNSGLALINGFLYSQEYANRFQ